MSCSNCFNGCVSITSDQCVKYTGVDIPILGIKNGDSLSYVEQALIEFLVSTLDGTGIIPDTSSINSGSSGISCTLVQQYLPTCGNITIVNLVTALIQAACNLQGQINDVTSELETLNADYTIGCLTGVSANSGTHAIVQVVITALCSTASTLTALIASLPNTYVQLDNLNELIDIHLEDTSNLVCNKMVPWVAVPFFDPDLTGKFDGTGAGIGDWLHVYLCNGSNGTPDLRGRVPVGVTDGTMDGGVMDAEVNPASDPTFNKIYTLNLPWGSNKNTLLEAQMPIHTHPNTALSPEHTHFTVKVGNDQMLTSTVPIVVEATYDNPENLGYSLAGTAGVADIGLTSPTAVTVNLTNVSRGSGLPHSNIQPVIGSYYIIYIP